LAAYGEVAVDAAMSAGAVDTLLISEGLRRQFVRLHCASCGNDFERVVADADLERLVSGPCPKCGSPSLSISEKEDFVERMFRRASEAGAKVRLISSESEEGEMLAKAFQGIAALLRYPWSMRPAPAAPRAPTT
jgi:peptide chain release factor subunit 1